MRPDLRAPKNGINTFLSLGFTTECLWKITKLRAVTGLWVLDITQITQYPPNSGRFSCFIIRVHLLHRIYTGSQLAHTGTPFLSTGTAQTEGTPPHGLPLHRAGFNNTFHGASVIFPSEAVHAGMIQKPELRSRTTFYNRHRPGHHSLSVTAAIYSLDRSLESWRRG